MKKSKGLTLNDRTVRNRIVNAGYQAALKSAPIELFSAQN